MATNVTNKTNRPLRVPLPGGKTLHLGPGKSGQISSKDAQHGALQKLVADATIELVDEETHDAQGGAGRRGGSLSGGHARGTASRRSGDR